MSLCLARECKSPRSRFSPWALQVLVLVVGVVPVSAAVFNAGAAQVDVTPPAGLPMYGYSERSNNHPLASGTLDPLYARVLVLDTDEKRLALVTLDLGRTFSEPWLNRLRSAARQTSRIDYLIVAASNTHSAPSILDDNPNEQASVWENAALNKIVGAVQRATDHLVPARMGADYGQYYARGYIAYNRRQVRSDGNVSMLWSNPSQIPTQPVDPIVTVVRIDDMAGDPIAILVNYACEPVILGADNLEYSADYVGVMVKTVAGAFGGKPVCFFLQGADGDINPYFASLPIGSGAKEKLDWTGRQLGEQAVFVAKNIRTSASPSPTLDFVDDAIAFPLRWEPQSFHKGSLRTDGSAVLQDHADSMAAPPSAPTLTLHVTTFLINKQFAFVSMPGEPFVEFQIDLRDRCPVQDCILLGHTNGYFGYFPTILAASQGGYGAGDSHTYVTVGAGERMLNHALIRMYEMLGDLRQVPDPDHKSSLVHLLDY